MDNTFCLNQQITHTIGRIIFYQNTDKQYVKLKINIISRNQTMSKY